MARELDLYLARLRSARDRYEAAHKFWFETSQEFSAIEKELVELLKSLGLSGSRRGDYRLRRELGGGRSCHCGLPQERPGNS